MTRAALRRLVASVAAEHGLSVEQMTAQGGNSRIPTPAGAARVKAASIARQQGASLPEIGAALRRHHTTVLHHLRGNAG